MKYIEHFTTSNHPPKISKYHDLGIIVLSCIDLAIQLHSPNSGDMKRATFIDILDEALMELDYYYPNDDGGNNDDAAKVKGEQCRYNMEKHSEHIRNVGNCGKC